MRIAYVANIRLPTEKAHGLQIMEMCRAFARNGHQVRLVVPRRKKYTTASSWEFYGLKPEFEIIEVPIFDFIPLDRWLGRAALWLNMAQFAVSAKRAVRSFDPEVVYSRDPWFIHLAPPGSRCVYEAHDFPKTVTPFHRCLWKRFSRIVTVTFGLKRAFSDEDVADEKVVVAHDAADPAVFDVAESKTEARCALGLPTEDFIAIYVGHLYPYKGADDALEACARLTHGATMLFVGGQPEDLERMKARAASLGVKNAVFAGPVPHARVPLYLRAADAAVLPTRASSRHAAEFLSPLKLFEYLAAGKAIVATDLPSAREVLDTRSAMLVPPEDPTALAAALNALAGDPARRAALERASIAHAASRSWSARAEVVLAGLPEPHPAAAWMRKHRLELTAALAAFALRAIYVSFFPQARLIGGDGTLYLRIADALRGVLPVGADIPPFYQPLYPMLLAALRSVFGSSLVWVRLFQAALSSATVFLMVAMAHRWSSRRAGAMTGILGALSVPMILESGILYTETLYAFLLTLSAFLTVRYLREATVTRALAAGGALALAGLTREIGFYLGILLAPFAAALRRPRLLAALIAVPVFLAMGLIVMRNAGLMASDAATPAPLLSKGYEATLVDPVSQQNLLRWRLYPIGLWHFFRLPHRLTDVSDETSTKRVLLSGDARLILLQSPRILAKGALTSLHWAVLLLAIHGLWRGRLERRAKFVFAAIIVFSAATIIISGAARAQGFEYLEPLARYRFPVEPLILLLAAVGIDRLSKTSRRMDATDMNGISPEFVMAVNLAYHEEEAAEYDSRHPEIFNDELGHWGRVAERISLLKVSLGRPIKIVDLGSGTGFVPLRLAPVLDGADEVVLTDLSPMMLSRARQSLAAAGFKPRATFLEGDAESLALPPGTVDVVTMNSVVHHLPSPEKVFSAVDRMLRTGGLVVIAHEPNLLHFSHPVVGNLDRLIRFLRALKSRRPRSAATSSPFIDRVNARLLERGVVKAPLTVEKIESIVDIHSPTAGRTVDAARGFDPRRLAARSFPGYAPVLLETYRHFGKLDVAKRPWLARVQRALERRWPEAGALFLLMLRKPKV